MSLYAEYFREREGKHTIETDEGFAIYQIDGEIVYLEHLYVSPHGRRSGLGSQLADRVMEQGKYRGCKVFLGSVVPSANGSTESLKALLAYGMKLKSSQDNMIWFEKVI